MRYGICTEMKNAVTVKKLGFDYVEPKVTAIMQMDKSQQKENLQLIADAGISAEAFNNLFPGDIKLAGPDADPNRTEEYLKRAFEALAMFGAKVVVFGSGFSRRCPEGYPFVKAYEQLLGIVRMAGGFGETYKIDVCVEPLSYSETNMINTISEGAVLASLSECQKVRPLADYYHMIANKDRLEHIAVIGDFGHIHIAAGAGRLYPVSREGEYYGTLIHNLLKINYAGRISIEGRTDDMEADGAKALKLLKQLEIEES